MEVPTEVLQQVRMALIRNIGDSRRCRRCGRDSIPADATTAETLEAWRALKDAMEGSSHG
jgi:hypothetical protein